MKIPIELLEKYNISQNHPDDEDGTYRTFLQQTDYEIIKGLESLFAEPSNFLLNFVKLAKNSAEICKYRAIARTEIGRSKK